MVMCGPLIRHCLCTPVFRDGEVVAIMGCVGHVADIGGTKNSLNAREIYEEGSKFPNKTLQRGPNNEDLISLIVKTLGVQNK
ncbi:MAG: hypothetical protein CM1200mP24_07040 [Gammaproteobacteria bacterium]|nr:MAG: hypothetical protein CM1200mP24_07040 [Gammaproteobacteria bacterium]